MSIFFLSMYPCCGILAFGVWHTTMCIWYPFCNHIDELMYIECAFLVAVRRPKIVFFSPVQTVSLTTKNVMLKCVSIGYNVQYLWKNGSGSSLSKVTGTNTNVLVIPDVRSIHGIIYTCVASNEGGNVTRNIHLNVTGMVR